MTSIVACMKTMFLVLLIAVCTFTALPNVTWAEEQEDNAQAQAKEAVRYPDVWCRMPPLTSLGFGMPRGLQKVYLDAQNHPVVSYVLSLPEQRAAVRYYNFFTGEVVGEYVVDKKIPETGRKAYEDEKQIEKQLQLRKAENLLSRPHKNLEIGEHGALVKRGYLHVSNEFGGMFPIDYGVEKVDADGRSIFDLMLIYTTEERRKVKNPFRKNTFWEGTNYSFLHSTSILAHIYDLQDGTYFLTGAEWAGMVRFRGSLDSPCLKPPIPPSFGKPETGLIVIDAGWARELYQKSADWVREQRDKGAEMSPRAEFIDRYFTKSLIEKWNTGGR